MSAFAPLSLSDRGRADLAAVGVTGMDTNLPIDEAYSQAATMAAYGVELLSIALSSPEIDMRRVRLAKDVFATLCATLINTRGRRRNVVTKMIEVRVANFKHAPHVDRESDLTSGTNICKQSRQPGNPTEQRSRVGGLSTVQRDCSTPNTRPPAQAPDTSNKRLDRISVEPTTDAIMLPAVSTPDSTAGESASETVNTSIAVLTAEPVEVCDPTLDQSLTTSLCRQDVIHSAFLSQGMPESDVVAYLNQSSNPNN
ncbi:hypothetical protein H4R27_006174 [Coemansia aciculifera]|nr:hypothetical protein H4R27_006174 [Coemansia aciculifera]